MLRVVLTSLLVAASAAHLRAPQAPHSAVPPAWQTLQPGIELADFVRTAHGSAKSYHVVVVRIDPSFLQLSIAAPVLDHHGRDKWTISDASTESVIAFNAGQFTHRFPWGWVVRNGHEVLPPGYGPLSTAVVVDRSGRVLLVDADSIPAMRTSGRAREAFQSYPSLLIRDGEIPAQLRAPGRSVDLEHRDSRLAIGTLADGRVLLVLTRFGGFDGAFGAIPIGPTTPEMAALMKDLGCKRAVLLDGGISGQLMVRDSTSVARTWPGLRKVVMGMVGARVRQ